MGENRWLKNSFVYLIILVAALALIFNYFSGSQASVAESGIYTVLADAKAGKVKSIDVQMGSSEITVNYRDTKVVRSRIENGDSITTLLVQAGVPLDSVDLKIGAAPAWGGLFNVISVLLPVILMIGFFVFFMRQAQGSNNQAMSFGKSRARKGKSLGRRRRARIRPFLALAQGLPSVHSPVGYGLLDHGSDQGADHVSQKPRSLNFKK